MNHNRNRSLYIRIFQYSIERYYYYDEMYYRVISEHLIKKVVWIPFKADDDNMAVD